MSKYVLYVMIVVSVLLSPVVAGVSGLTCPAKTATVLAKAAQGKSNDGHSKLARAHACCTAHVHYGYSSHASEYVPALLIANQRPPLLEDQIPGTFGPNPLIEPPTHA